MNDLVKLLDTETKEELREAYEEGRFKFLGDVGFVAWLELIRDGQLWIYINDLYILPEHRTFTNMKKFYKELEKFFKKKYKNAIFYWKKDNQFYYR